MCYPWQNPCVISVAKSLRAILAKNHPYESVHQWQNPCVISVANIYPYESVHQWQNPCVPYLLKIIF
ncbi:MAG: hypothetical protein F6K39_32955 [Okeania sp. SIO3B3]|nr:hypothetical protein [Okeania sp. SIO3B3]